MTEQSPLTEQRFMEDLHEMRVDGTVAALAINGTPSQATVDQQRFEAACSNLHNARQLNSAQYLAGNDTDETKRQQEVAKSIVRALRIK